MARHYETPSEPRFKVERGANGERIRVPARWNVFFLIFLPIWLVFWTVGGFAALEEFARTGNLFLVIWLVGWAAGELYALLMLAWMIWGAETLRVTGGDLEIGESLFGWTKSRLYRGDDLRNLEGASGPGFLYQFQVTAPFVMKPKWGSVKFNYGARTVYAAQGLDEAEGRMIADWLLARLPRRAAEGSS